jgi:hypothetical protein
MRFLFLSVSSCVLCLQLIIPLVSSTFPSLLPYSKSFPTIICHPIYQHFRTFCPRGVRGESTDRLVIYSGINQMSHGILLPSPMSKPFVQLPYELWSHIATFFTIEEIERTKFYALNLSFLALYLRERYKTLQLTFESGSSYSTHSNCIVLSRKLDHIQ